MSQYVTPAELTLYGANAFAIQKISNDEQVAACVAASTSMDSYFRGRYPLPFLTFDVDIKMRAAHIATWLLLSQRGRDPGAGYDDQIDERYKEAIKWCEGVQRQSIHPNVTISNPNPPSYQLPAVITSRQRGWSRGCT